MRTREPTDEFLFGDSYQTEVKKQKPNYDAAPYNHWPDGTVYEAFVDSGLEYGPEDLPFHVNELPQIRSSYDPDKMEDLADRLRSPENRPPYFKQLQAIRIGEFDNAEDLQRFLDNYQLYYQLETMPRISDLSSEPNGRIRLLDFGHRRTRGIKIVTTQMGYTVKNRDVKKEIIANPEFDDFIDDQSRENEHDRVALEDDAEDIRRRFNYIKYKTGIEPSKAELGRLMGVSADKVRDALRFTELPEEVRAYFKNGFINYEVAVLCWRLIDVAKTYYSSKYPDKYEVGGGKLAEDAKDLTIAELNKFTKNHMAGASYARKFDILKGKIDSLTTSYAILTDDFFGGAYESPATQRAETGKQVGRFALEIIKHRIETGALSDQELHDMRQVMDVMALEVEKRKEAAAKRQAEEDRARLDVEAAALFSAEELLI